MRKIALCLLFAALCTPLFGQTSQVGQVSGRVSDPTGAIVPGAHVSITNTATNATRAADSGADGSYALTNLPVGTYRLSVTMNGFNTYVQNGIILDVDSHPEINVTLEVGQVSQQVEVQANAAMVETQSNGVGQVVEQQSVVDLPLNGRNITQLVALSGAATNMLGAGSGQSLVSNKNYPTVAAYSIAGAQPGQTLFVLDGSPNMDPVSNVGLPMPFPDALQEFKVQTSSLPANYGAQPGGVVNVVTKSGTNSIHGDAFEFVRNAVFDARNYFATSRDSLKRNQFGGTVGGPIIKDKVFFFAGYQGTYESTAPSANTAFVETAATLAGDFTAITAASCNGGTAVTLKAPFVGNKIDPTVTPFNPVALKVLALMPVSTDPCGKLIYTIPSSDHETQLLGKVDYTVSSRQTFFARYYVTDYLHPFFYKDNILTMSQNSSVGLADRVNTAVVGHTFVINQDTTNSLRASFARSAIHRTTPVSPTPESLGVNAYEGVKNYMFFNASPDFTVDCQNCSPGPWISNDYQVNDDLTLVRGKHQIALGASWLHSHLNARGNFQNNGTITFNGQVTGLTLADLMMGDVSTIGQSMGQVAHESINVPGFYAQDNIRINSRLSINPGIRWDPFLLPVNYDGQQSIFNPVWFTEGIHSTRFPNAPAGVLFQGDSGMPGKGYAYGKIWNFAPRFGLVFDPRGKGQETIRAGWGMFYGATPLFLQAGAHAPFAGPVSVTLPAGGLSNPFLGYPGGYPLPVPNPPPSNITFPLFGGGLGAFELHPKPTYMEQWNVSFQKQIRAWLFSATYLGNRTAHLEMGDNLDPLVYIPGTVQGGNCTSVPGAPNGGVYVGGPYNGLSDGLTTNVTPTTPLLGCSTTGNVNYRRAMFLANPAQGQFYSGVTNFGDFGVASYNGLLVSAQHRFTQNFSVLSNLTWSHCLTESEIGLNGGTTPQNYLNPRAEYANCQSDERRVLNVSIVARTPHFGSEWVQRFAGNWQVAPIFTANTGNYSTVTQGGADTSLVGNSRPNLVAGAVEKLDNPTIAKWFNTAAYSNVLPNTFGNLSRSTILNPGAWNVDMAISRSFPITEHQSITFRAEAFNLFNHTRLGAPGTTLATKNTFGVIMTAADPRIMQMALKYTF